MRAEALKGHLDGLILATLGRRAGARLRDRAGAARSQRRRVRPRRGHAVPGAAPARAGRAGRERVVDRGRSAPAHLPPDALGRAHARRAPAASGGCSRARSRRCWHELARASSRTSWRARRVRRGGARAARRRARRPPRLRAGAGRRRVELTRLGGAREIAGQCADELAADDARRGALRRVRRARADRGRARRVAGGARRDRLPRLSTTASAPALVAAGDRSRSSSARRSRSSPARSPPGARCAAAASRVLPARRGRARSPPRTRVALGGGARRQRCRSRCYAVDFAPVLPVWWLALAPRARAAAARRARRRVADRRDRRRDVALARRPGGRPLRRPAAAARAARPPAAAVGRRDAR